MTQFCVPPIVISLELQNIILKIVELNEPMNSRLRGTGVLYQPVICDTISATMDEEIEFKLYADSTYDSPAHYDEGCKYDLTEIVGEEVIEVITPTNFQSFDKNQFSNAFN